MAASSVSVASGWCPSDCSGWERAFWERGSQAAESYCVKKVEDLNQIKTALNDIAQLFSNSPDALESIEDMVNGYEATQQRYERDWASLISSEKHCHINIQGRGEPGRHPFNFPSFRRRYHSLKDLQSHFSKKSEKHARYRDILEIFFQSLPPESSQESAIIKTWIVFHETAVKKWLGRKMDIGKLERLQELASQRSSAQDQLKERLEGLLVPSKTTAHLSTMAFDLAHRQEFYGLGATISVCEGGCDTSHSLLKDFVTDLTDHLDQRLPEDQVHGTSICGIVRQAAPLAKIEVFARASQLKRRIINFSGWCPDPFSILLSKPDLLEEHLSRHYSEGSSPVKRMRASSSLASPLKKKTFREIGSDVNRKSYLDSFGDLTGKLLIQSIGNQGVVLDQNEVVAQGFQGVIGSDENKKRTIFVVNLHSNAHYPAPTSCLPGKSLAEMTLCAIGSMVNSSIPGNRYARKTGTSQAAAFVTSAAALIEAKFPKLSAEQIRSCLLKSATPIVLDERGRPRLVIYPDRLRNHHQHRIDAGREIYGMGLLNAHCAMQHAQLMNFQLRLSEEDAQENRPVGK